MFRHLLAAAVLSVLLPTVSAVAENIINFSNHGTVRWQCVEVIDGEDIPLTDHVVKEVALGCASSHQLLYPDRHFDAVSRERIHTSFTAEAQALLVKYTLSPTPAESDCGGARTTEHPDGSCPITGGASCSTFTCASKGDASGTIDEASATQLDFNTRGSNTLGNYDYGYKSLSDTGDIHVKGRAPSSFGGFSSDFTGVGPSITEGTGDSDYFAHCWCPKVGRVRFTTGTPSSAPTQIGQTGSCFDKYLLLEYDQSASQLACYESTDNSNWTSAGSPVSKTLACTGDSCPSGIMAQSADSGQTSSFSVTDIEADTELDVLGVGGGGSPADPENIVWEGIPEDGTYDGWQVNGSGELVFPLTPEYGRPIQYGGQNSNHVGNGDLIGICHKDGGDIGGVTYEQCPFTPIGGSDYAFRFTVKNSANGTEPDDCDVPFPTCDRRRSEIGMQSQLFTRYGGFENRKTWWMSVSHYVPSDWSDSGSGFGPNVADIKTYNDAGAGNVMLLQLHNGVWEIHHTWDPPNESIKWQHRMFYSGNLDGACYPRDEGTTPWPDGLLHFPDEATSCAALQSVNKGGWTHWVFHIHWDERGAASGGTGFMRVYKAEDDGPYVQVLNIFAGEVTRGGLTFDHGVGHSADAFGPKVTMYGEKGQFWGLPANRVIYSSNIKVGDANATCADMTHDGRDCTQ